MIRVEALAKRFSGVVAAAGLDAEFRAGTVTAIIGPNGSGKTTLLNLICGYLRPDAGTITCDDQPIVGLTPHRIAELGVARTFQTVRLVRQISALENALLAATKASCESLLSALSRSRGGISQRAAEEQARECLATVGLSSLQQQRAGQLSYGEQKLLTLACALARRPRCVLLDEPIAGIHSILGDRVLAVLQGLADKGLAVALIEHDMAAVARVADVAILLVDGKVVAHGQAANVLADTALQNAYAL